MDRFQQMKIYVAVAEEQGFAAAARRLGVSPPAVTRAIAGLEQRLGSKLLVRTTRHVRVTETGRRYLEDAREILASVVAADEAAAGINGEPHGSLAVTAPVLFGRRYVTPGIIDYLQHYPGMQVEAVFVDRVVNLLEEGLDVGVRIGELPDSSMQALRVGSIRTLLVVAPDYITQHGIPQVPQDLLDHTLIVSSAGSMGTAWRFAEHAGEQALRVEPRLRVNTNDAAIEAVRAGFGIARLLSYQVADELGAGRLQIVLEDFERPAQPVHIVHREGRYGSVKVRAFIDMLAARLRADLKP